MSKLIGVSDTLYIPLTARIYISKRYPEYFYDEVALSLQDQIPSNSISKGSNQYSMLASVARYYNFDKVIKDFIERKKKCNIVNLGCGLETACSRINDDRAYFYEIDLFEVIENRKRVLKTSSNEKLISADIFKNDWMKQVDKSVPTLFVVSGVFQYFHEEDVLGLIEKIKNNFDDCEMIFDAMSKSGLIYANRYVKKTGNDSALMYFYVDNSNDFAKLSNTTLIQELKFFKDARRILKGKLNLFSIIATWMVDKGQGRILHLKIK